MTIKSNYKNAQNKWQEIIELNKKKIFKKNSFQEISNNFIKKNKKIWMNGFNLIIYLKESIYLLQVIWSNFICIQFSKKLFTFIFQKNLLQNFNLTIKIIFTYFYYKVMNFYNFI